MPLVDIPKNRFLGVHCSIAGGVASAPAIGAKLGCSAIQIFTSSNQQWRVRPISEEEAELLRAGMKSGGIRMAFAHAGYLINLAAPDQSIYARSIKAMSGELSRADMLRLPFVVLHPGAPKEKGAEWGIKRAAEAIRRIFDSSPEARARIALETTAGQGSSIGRSFEEIAAIIELADVGDKLCVCFDTCHAFSAGYELRTASGYKKTWKEFAGAIGMKRLVAIHLNDSKGELGSRIDRHEQIGKGKIGLDGFRNIMNDRRLVSIPMVLETPKGENLYRNDARNLRILVKLAVGAGR